MPFDFFACGTEAANSYVAECQCSCDEEETSDLDAEVDDDNARCHQGNSSEQNFEHDVLQVSRKTILALVCKRNPFSVRTFVEKGKGFAV